MNFGIGTPKDLTLTNKKLPKWNEDKYAGKYLDKKLLFLGHKEYSIKKLNKFSRLIYKVREIYPEITFCCSTIALENQSILTEK